jgi:hypothetical protein
MTSPFLSMLDTASVQPETISHSGTRKVEHLTNHQ